GTPADGRCEMGVSVCGECEVAAILLGIASLFQGAQHEKGKYAFLRLTCDLLRQLLVHAWRDVNFLRDFNLASAFAGTVCGSAIGLELHSLNRQRPHPK